MTFILMFISELIGVPDDDWEKYYNGKGMALVLYLIVGFWIYTLQKDNLNDKMLEEFAQKIYKQNETLVMMNNL